MQAKSDSTGVRAIVEAYGARLAVSAPDGAALDAIIGGLPVGWSVAAAASQDDDVSWRFAVLREPNGYLVIHGDGQEQRCAELKSAVWLLRAQMRRYVGHHAKSLIFVHAGVVAYEGRAILLPGHSFAGKSTLVVALVRAGAEYYSDEFALLDDMGRVAQYREPIALRGPNGREELPLGPESEQVPVPIGLVALTVYQPGAQWAPRRLSAAEGVVATMEHAVPARDRPAETLSTLRLALANAEVLRGDRGEADETAAALLDAVGTARG